MACTISYAGVLSESNCAPGKVGGHRATALGIIVQTSTQEEVVWEPKSPLRLTLIIHISQQVFEHPTHPINYLDLVSSGWIKLPKLREVHF